MINILVTRYSKSSKNVTKRKQWIRQEELLTDSYCWLASKLTRANNIHVQGVTGSSMDSGDLWSDWQLYSDSFVFKNGKTDIKRARMTIKFNYLGLKEHSLTDRAMFYLFSFSTPFETLEGPSTLEWFLRLMDLQRSRAAWGESLRVQVRLDNQARAEMNLIWWYAPSWAGIWPGCFRLSILSVATWVSYYRPAWSNGRLRRSWRVRARFIL